MSEEIECDEARGASSPEEPGELENELDGLVRELEIKTARLKIGRLEKERIKTESELEIELSNRNYMAAEEKYTLFRDLQKNFQIRERELDIQEARDEHKESKEELEQLEMMYADAEVEDRTGEIVLNRSRRRMELSLEHLKLMERRFETLKSRELPLELAELEQEMVETKTAQNLARISIDISMAEKEIELIELEGEIVGLKKKIKRIKGEIAEVSESTGKDDS